MDYKKKYLKYKLKYLNAKKLYGGMNGEGEQILPDIDVNLFDFNLNTEPTRECVPMPDGVSMPGDVPTPVEEMTLEELKRVYNQQVSDPRLRIKSEISSKAPPKPKTPIKPSIHKFKGIRPNKTGYTGVYLRPSGKYRWEAQINMQTVGSGGFLTPEDASEARDTYLKSIYSMDSIPTPLPKPLQIHTGTPLLCRSPPCLEFVNQTVTPDGILSEGETTFNDKRKKHGQVRVVEKPGWFEVQQKKNNETEFMITHLQPTVDKAGVIANQLKEEGWDWIF